jgi:hypothetical protein
MQPPLATRKLRIGASLAVAALGLMTPFWLPTDRSVRDQDPRLPSPAVQAPIAAPPGAPTARAKSAARERGTAQTERVIYTEYQGSETRAFSARHPQLEDALEIEDADPAWTARVEHKARELLAGDPAIHSMRARCTQTFCRLQIVKPISSALDWPQIDSRLAAIAQGEAIFQTQDEGGTSTAYLYFSAKDSHLPIAALDMQAASEAL